MKPGKVYLHVYNMFGVLVESIYNGEYMTFHKEKKMLSHSFNLKESGTYMLKLTAPNNEQYI